MPDAVLNCLHPLAATFWVGGMAVMHFAVRPAAVAAREPPRAAAALNAIRRLVAANLALGTLVFVLAVVGRAL